MATRDNLPEKTRKSKKEQRKSPLIRMLQEVFDRSNQAAKARAKSKKKEG